MLKNSASRLYGLTACFLTLGMQAPVFSAGAEVVFAEPLTPLLTNLNQLNQTSGNGWRMVCKLQLSGTVLFTDTNQGWVALQDDSGTALAQFAHSGSLKPGDRIRLAGRCSVEGYRLSPEVVENDGRHGTNRLGLGSIFLQQGKHQIRLDWFNGIGEYSLGVYYNGPGIPDQRIPPASLFRVVTEPSSGTTNWSNGLDYRAYEGRKPWFILPDFKRLRPIKTGIATNFDVNLLTRSTNAGIEFRGYIDVPKDGLYSFSTRSDDGSRLFIDEDVDPLRMEVLATNVWPKPRQLAPGQIVPADDEGGWADVKGTITFAGERSGGLELELSSAGGHMRIRVADSSDCPQPMLAKSRVRIRGFSEIARTVNGLQIAGLLLVQNFNQLEFLELPQALWNNYPVIATSNVLASFPVTPNALVHLRGKLRTDLADNRLIVEDETGRLPLETTQPLPKITSEEVEVLGHPRQTGTNIALICAFYRELVGATNQQAEVLPLLTTAEQVKQLSLQEAARKYPVRIRGVATERWKRSGVIQDSTCGIFWSGNNISDWFSIGQYWEIKGETYAGYTPGINVTQARFLCQGSLPEPVRPSWDQLNNGSLDTFYVEIQGVVTAAATNAVTLLTPGGSLHVQLPAADAPSLGGCVGALVRLRGCLGASFDNNHQINAGRINLYSVSVNLDAPAPADPFAMPAKRISELRLFDFNASALQRVKVTGQIVGGSDGQYYLMEGTNGLRFIPQQPLTLKIGDQVEIVGFPELGSSSPVLREAVMRRLGSAPLPPGLPLAENALFQASHDATRVKIESQLVELRSNGTEELLELQNGPRTYMARLVARSGRLPQIPLRSRVAVTGIYASRGTGLSNRADSFELLLNSPADITILERPSWWTPGHAVIVAGVLVAALLAATGWIRILHRQVERKTRLLRIEIEEHKRTELEVERIHKKLVDTSRQAGMAEVATSVLHNVGNVLNSVNVSATLISDQLKQSKIVNVRHVAELLREHESDLGDFLTMDPKGKQIPLYLDQLAKHLANEQTSTSNEVSSLGEKIDHINNIVAMQQNYANVAGVEELVKVTDLVEDALRMNAGALERHQVQVRREYDPRAPQIIVDKHKVLQILINLLRNAKYACDESGRRDKLITVGIVSDGDLIRITVADNGVGIPAENLERIFSQGFTTRKNGHGFGLHNGILAARELGGALTVHSEGVGKGASFALVIPLKSGAHSRT